MTDGLQIVYIPIKDVTPYSKNARRHKSEDVSAIKASIEAFGFNDPIAVWGDKNIIVEGHGRLIAAKELGMDAVPCLRLDRLTDEERRAYTLAHNKTAELSEWDTELLSGELANILDIDMTSFGFLDEDDKASEAEKKAEAKKTLRDFFLVPPFSILDTRQGYWQERKAAWNVLIGDASETRDGDSQTTFNTGGYDYLPQVHGQTSNFDPVFAEAMMLWFNRPGGKILDPFGGEQTKGVVAGELGCEYHGCEFRADQVETNRRHTAEYEKVHYYCGDSNNISDIISEREFDMCFTSPPYYDLEVYSKEDMSALGTYEEFMSQYKNIFSQCYDMMKENSFLVLKITEIRDKKTGIYRGFVPDNIRIMEEIGFKYYNEIIIVNNPATAAMTVSAQFKNRKVGRTHQNVVVFYKGDPERAHENALVFYKGNQKDIGKIYPELNPEMIVTLTQEESGSNGAV